MFKNKRVLVTGSTGLVGRKVVDLLLAKGAEIQTVSLDDAHVLSDVYRLHHNMGDLCDFEFCQMLTEHVDYVFHIAGIKGGVGVTLSHPASMFIPCVQMNTNILEACRINNVEGILFVSSVGAYAPAPVLREDNPEGEPMDSYPGWAKRTAEKQIFAYRAQYGLHNFHIVRPTNVYGEGDNFDPDNAMVIPSLLAKILRGDKPVVVWGDGSPVRDFVYSGDVAQGIIDAMRYGTGETFLNLGGAKSYSIYQLILILRSFLDFDFLFDMTKPSGYPKRVMDSSLARKLIGYKPETSLVDGLMKTFSWLKQHPDEHLKKQNYFRGLK